MADCSKTEVFLAEWKRMCDTFIQTPCDKCSAYDVCFEIRNIDRQHELVDIVQKWSDEHPAPKPKTYADVFREKFPKNTMQDWALWQHEICRKQLFEGADTERCEGDCKECWNEPYKEEET